MHLSGTITCTKNIRKLKMRHTFLQFVSCGFQWFLFQIAVCSALHKLNAQTIYTVPFVCTGEALSFKDMPKVAPTITTHNFYSHHS